MTASRPCLTAEVGERGLGESECVMYSQTSAVLVPGGISLCLEPWTLLKVGSCILRSCMLHLAATDGTIAHLALLHSPFFFLFSTASSYAVLGTGLEEHVGRHSVTGIPWFRCID